MSSLNKVKNSGEKKEKTEWHNVTVKGPAAKFVANYLTKGNKVYLEGQLETRKYQKDGSDRYATDVVSFKVENMTAKTEQFNQSSGHALAPAANKADDLDDIPFPDDNWD